MARGQEHCFKLRCALHRQQRGLEVGHGDSCTAFPTSPHWRVEFPCSEVFEGLDGVNRVN